MGINPTPPHTLKFISTLRALFVFGGLAIFDSHALLMTRGRKALDGIKLEMRRPTRDKLPKAQFNLLGGMNYKKCAVIESSPIKCQRIWAKLGQPVLNFSTVSPRSTGVVVIQNACSPCRHDVRFGYPTTKVRFPLNQGSQRANV
jgi:hypothetical protein